MRRELLHSRALALVALGAFFLHQLHFLFASGLGVGGDLREAGHSFLGHVPTALAVLGLVLLAGRLLFAHLGHPRRSMDVPRSPTRRWAHFAVAVFVVFFVQEAVEALLFAQHAESFLAGLGEGCWLTILLAGCLGPLLVAADRWIGRIETLVAQAGRKASASWAEVAAGMPHITGVFARLSPLAFGLARRPPPLISSRL